MDKSSTKLEKAIALLGQLNRAELDVVRGLASSRLETFVSEDTECRFLKLSAELRNIIYHMVAVDYAKSVVESKSSYQNGGLHHHKFGLALTNKQISAEHLSVLNSEQVASAEYYHTESEKWVMVAPRKLLEKRLKIQNTRGEDELYDVRIAASAYICSDVQGVKLRAEAIADVLERCCYGGLIRFDPGKAGSRSFDLKRVEESPKASESGR